MIGKQKIWNLQKFDKEKAGCFAAELEVSSLVTGILLERGFNDAESMREFLYGSKKPFHNPFLLKDMQKVTARIEAALQNGEMITVYGDYDVDGITASSLLYLYLQRRGANVNTYIPKRKSEGYGLNDEALKNIFENGTRLVITVDCGISGVKEISNAPREMDIIITDHHTVPEILPQAYAIINPKQADCGYPFKQLSGVGVAFKLCQALEMSRGGSEEYWEDLTELAALGTVADIVPLYGENREIVRRGLKAMENTGLVGLRALITASGCPETGISSENIGFILAPRLNAVGRLEHAQSAVSLLTEQDKELAESIAADLNRENTIRQEISRSIMEEAEAMLAKEKHIDTAIVLASEGWHQGVIGIVASRLVDKYHLPTILISISDGVAKGSCRSIPALNLYDAIAAESDILTQFGGHHQAAGLTLPADKLEEFKLRFKNYVRQHLREEDYLPQQNIDYVLGDNGLITVRDLQDISLLEPFGCNNPTPVFAFKNAVIHNQRAIGKDRNHLQFIVDKGDCSYKALMWNKADLLPLLYDGMLADIAFIPKLNVWNNETTVQLHAASVLQNVTICDLRNIFDDKKRLLQEFLRLENGITVYMNRVDKYTDIIDERLHLTVYGEQAQDKTAVLYDLPECSLTEVINQLKDENVKNIVLMYNETDKIAGEAELERNNPDRERMAVVYKKVMEELRISDFIDVDELLNKYDFISENALLIMAELGFVVKNDGKLSKGIIKKSCLNDSSLYTFLQQERVRLSRIYTENLRLSQYDLLRS